MGDNNVGDLRGDAKDSDLMCVKQFGGIFREISISRKDLAVWKLVQECSSSS